MRTSPTVRPRAARFSLPVVALGLVVGACAPGPTAPPTVGATAVADVSAAQPSDGAPAVGETAVLPTAPDVVAEAMVALNADKFDCKPMESEKGVGACDVEKQGVPSLVLVYGEPVLFLLSHFLRKPEVGCDQILSVVNEVNKRVDRLKLVCIEDRVTFMTPLLVSTKGLAHRDLQEGATWFRQTVQMVLATSGLVESLQ